MGDPSLVSLSEVKVELEVEVEEEDSTLSKGCGDALLFLLLLPMPMSKPFSSFSILLLSMLLLLLLLYERMIRLLSMLRLRLCMWCTWISGDPSCATALRLATTGDPFTILRNDMKFFFFGLLLLLLKELLVFLAVGLELLLEESCFFTSSGLPPLGTGDAIADRRRPLGLFVVMVEKGVRFELELELELELDLDFALGERWVVVVVAGNPGEFILNWPKVEALSMRGVAYFCTVVLQFFCFVLNFFVFVCIFVFEFRKIEKREKQAFGFDIGIGIATVGRTPRTFPLRTKE